MRDQLQPQNDAQIIEQIRIHIAFEQLIVSVLTGAGLGAALVMVFSFAQAVIGGGFSAGLLLSVVIKTFMTGFMIFLIGFFAIVIVITPLFKALETARRRTVWPYLAAALVIAGITLAAAAQFPPSGRLSLPLIIAVFAASVAAALDFGRRMQPFWRAASKADADADADAEPDPNVRRLH